MFDRVASGEKALIVHVEFTNSLRHEQDDPRECMLLAESAGGEVQAVLRAHRPSPDAKFFVGTGKAEEIAEFVRNNGTEIIIFNHILSPSQERNLEKLCECRVIDRTGLILDIFAQRARSFEGKLQVELAQLRYVSTRLIRGWTHLERQRGGIGMRGPGETQLETDRRLIKVRIANILGRLEKVAQQRELGRAHRAKSDIASISLVGYTNAGKSTLFNHLTGADVFAEDQLFATLDTTMRRIALPQGTEAVIADTVGFVRHLPHALVAAFRSTLKETREATLLLHVIDAAEDDRDVQKQHVLEVLREIKADEVPMLEVYNKVDRLLGNVPRIEYDIDGVTPVRVWLSALTGAGCDLLMQAIALRLRPATRNVTLMLPPHYGKLRSILYRERLVKSEIVQDDGIAKLEIDVAQDVWDGMIRQHPELLSFCVSA
ncbi:ribosome rescue GTPase HflX [Chrysiogenes arsenatis]|uniref:ribosome rescue GTPase HflX n=1 Tax=Chrysiogenes arsenatis TaxID=309797 RepID=UPI0003FDBE1F|nr:ribosome rescue GTPase HflX [Chrysiogenes arsenatis]